MIKKCPRCGIRKDETLFYKCKKSWTRRIGNLSIHCIRCSAEYNKEQRKKHIEKRRLWDREYYQRNKARVAAWGKSNRAKMKRNNPARYRAYKFFSGKGRREISPDINRPYLEKLFLSSRICRCCGKKMELGFSWSGKSGYKTNFSSPSIDRVDNHRGYSKDNIAVICWQCNQRKTDLTLSDLEMFMRYIKKYVQ